MPMILLSLIQNIALLVTLSVVHQVILQKSARGTLRYQILSGLLFGGAGVAVMLTPFRFAPGIIFDSRSIILSVAGLFGGPLVAAVAAAICGTFRIWSGGSGVWVGVMVIMEAAALGVGFHFLRRKDERFAGNLWLAGFGLLVHIPMLAILPALPGGLGYEALRHIALPVLFLYPLATLLVCRIFLSQEKHLAAEMGLLESEGRYRMLAESSQTGVYIHQDEKIVYANSRFAELHGYTVAELMGTNYFDLFHPDEKARALDIQSKRLQGEEAPRQYEMKRIRKDGTPFFCETAAVRIDYQGKPAIMGNIIDISARKEAEEQRNRLILNLQAALARVELLSTISQTVNRSLNLDQVLNDALDKVMELYQPHSTYIRLYEAEARELVFAVQKGLSPAEFKQVTRRLKLDQAVAAHAIQTGEAVAIEDVVTDPRAAKRLSFARQIGCRSVVAIILYAKDAIVGSMSIRWLLPHAFTTEEIRLFTAIGHQVGTAIENARLFSQVQRQTEMLAILNAVSETVSRTLDMEKLISDIIEKVIALLHGDGGNIRFLDEHGQTLEMIAHRGFSTEQAAKMNIRRKYGEGISWECLEKNRVIFTEFNPEDAYQQKINSFGMRIGAACAIHFPIISKDLKLGILSIYSFSLREFRKDEIELCTGIGRQVGIAIENARLYQQAQNNIKALKDAQTEREKIIEKLQKALGEVKTLSGLLPICSHCKKIRDDQGYWNQIEAYIHKHSGTEFSHGICPDCARKFYPEFNLYDKD